MLYNMKKIRKMGWKIFFALFEKKYHFNNHTLKYLFVNNHTKNLCVVFSAFPDKDAMPGYNLVRTLVPNNRNFSYLFLLDDMVNIPRGGSYYLGCEGDYYGIELVNTFLRYMIDKYHFSTTIAVGSSKAGTAALMFGLPMHMNYLIIGACQYKIGTYLNCGYHMNTLKKLTGYNEIPESVINALDQIVPNAVLNNDEIDKTKIFIHYSTQEHTYKEHIEQLIDDLHKKGYSIIEDIRDYSDHGDVKYYFPKFLLDSLKVIEKELGI